MHPSAEVLGFGLALRVGEVGDGGDAVLDDAGVADEGHVGRSLAGVEDADVGDGAEGVVEDAPLGEGAIARRAVEVAGHPRVDDVVDVVPLGRAHEVGRAAEVGRWDEARDGGDAGDSEGHGAGSCFPLRGCPARGTAVKGRR